MPPSATPAVAEPTQLPAIRRPAVDALKEIEQVVLQGNLGALPEAKRIAYYARVCESLGLNPLTRPFEYMELQGKTTLYARKDATDQLRQIHGVNVERLERERTEELQIVTAYVHDRYGRHDSAIGAVSIKNLSGEALANALMKAETKAKRRATLSIVGLGWMDEIEAMDQRAMEVAPRAAVTSAIASRTAALTGGATEPGESDAADAMSGSGAEAAAASSQGVTAAGSPACAHDPKNREATDEGVVCTDCGTLLAERAAAEEPVQAKPRTRGRKKPAEPKKAGDDGYWRARAHAMADERGLDPDALKRVAGDVLSKEGDWSRTELNEDDWQFVAGVVETAPTRLDDDDAWLEAATVFAGNSAIAAGIVKKLVKDADWAPVEKSAAAMFSEDDVEKLDASDWVEYGLRIGAKA